MTTKGIPPTWERLPVTRDLTLLYQLSLTIGLFLLAGSALGLLSSDQVYPTANIRELTLANDVISLVVGLPALLVSLALARRGSLLGLLFWPGALFYVIYNAIAYVFLLPLNASFLLALGQLILSVYTTVALTAAVDVRSLRRQLQGGVSEKIAASALMGLGAAFLLLALGTMGAAALGLAPPPSELPVFVADSLTAPAWIIGGVLLWRRQPLGYLAGGALLFQASMLFVGVIGIMFLQPLITHEPFLLVDTLVLAGMGLVCFVPTVLFARGAVSGAIK